VPTDFIYSQQARHVASLDWKQSGKFKYKLNTNDILFKQIR